MADLTKILNEFIVNPISKTLNGIGMELGKVYSNPFARAFNPISEDTTKKLRVFDFDDTLVKTNSYVYVKHSNGKVDKLTPGEYAIYEPKKDDEFDFTDFQKVTEPQEIKGITNLLKTLVRSEGERTISILTARAAYKPVKDYLRDIGMGDIYVAALGNSDPQMKADWIEQKIKSGYNDVYFIDDSHKNVTAVNNLKKKYPNIKLRVQHVKHDTPKPPKQSHIKENINRLKTLIPKK